jgi:hypothetical protein
MKIRTILGGMTVVAGLAVIGGVACERFSRRGAPDAPTARRHAPVVGLGPQDLRLAPPSAGTHRLLLDTRALARLKDSAHRQTPAFRHVVARADEAMAAPIASGYQGFEWADAVANASLAWHATGDARYASSASRYLRALLDDRFVIGDKKGGKDVVTHDSGYGIRTFGAYAALGYDWLRSAPEMDAALRALVVERLDQWLGWYENHGYLRDHPTANYYWGYLTTLSFAGLAASGESPAADRWLRRARDELSTKVLPTFREELRGGGWPEGGQYCDYTTTEIALVAEAFRSGANIDVAGKLPWLEQMVTAHVHALLPDERSVYDGRTSGEHPARPSGLALAALSIALEGVNDGRAAEARWMTAHALPPLRRERAWVGLLADRPGGLERNPRNDARTSLHVAGMGLTFARSDWSKAAVWASFQAGPRLAEDHQDADQGHFELVRGSDHLLVDGGGSEGSATINHNTLLVDDGGRHLNYPPNQGVWGHKVRTVRFGDDGHIAVAVGEIGEAYAPSCVREGCTKRSVERLTRTFVFVRPSLLVLHDDIALERSDVAVTWATHVTRAPMLAGNLASAVVGSSRVDVRTLEPAEARAVSLKEPTPSGEGSHRLNQPWGPMWRIEVPSARDEREREFLHFITAGPSEAAPPASERIRGKGLGGAAGVVQGRRIVVLFAAGEEIERSASLGGTADVVALVGLTPGKRYRTTLDAGSGCTIRVSESTAGSDAPATSGGFLRINASRCDGR